MLKAKNHNKILLFLFIIFSLFFLSGCGQNPIQVPETILAKERNSEEYFEKVKVKRVVDGDTIEVNRTEGKEKVRFVLVNTPETKHPTKGVEYYGKEASAFTKKSLEGKTVYLQKDTSDKDKYGRLLRYIWTQMPSSQDPDKEEIRKYCFNAKLLLDGYAQVSTFPPDLKYLDVFLDCEKEARDNSKGLWGKSPKKEKTEKTKSSVKEGKIKGNKKSKIYHMPGSKSYNKISKNNVVYFDSEEEAIKAGYRKARK